MTDPQGNNEHHGVIGQKRKSDENQRTGDSPEQKRNSSELQGVLEAEGLPSDLQRMKKEQLVSELVKRGELEYSMKNLKSELIDALKAILLGNGDTKLAANSGEGQLGNQLELKEVHQDLNESQNEMISAPVNNSTQKQPIISGVEPQSIPSNDITSGGQPLGRGSMALSSIRSQVRESLAMDNASGAQLHHPRASVEAELQARLLRHRDSQAMKPIHSTTLPPTMAFDQVKGHHDPNMRVSALEMGKMSEQIVPVVELLVEHDENLADEVLSSDEIAVTENTHEEVNNPPIISKSAIPSTDKPSNLLSHQTSFLNNDKKPLVPALLKAERLKEQEELKLAERRRKEAERKVK